MRIAGLTAHTADAVRNAAAFAHDLVRPTVRLGVTGLARSGKTVFITALIHNLVAGGRLPFLDAAAQGRLRRAYLEPQPDDAVPRFDYERHLGGLLGDPPSWPESTRRLSQLRLTLEYEPAGFLSRRIGRDRLHVDIVDYPGEWLLDLPLIGLSYEVWSRQAVAMAREPGRERLAKAWLGHLSTLDPAAEADEAAAAKAAGLFTDYLRECRDGGYSTAPVPPGRFLMPGELEGSPALTFSPLALPGTGRPPRGSLWAMMARRYEAYKAHVVKPFFRNHFARLDRQIVLVDVLDALNGGPDAGRDLERALAGILDCFRPGANTWLSRLLARRIDRVVFAATKADHLHHTSHDRLEAILARLAEDAIARAERAGADVRVSALAAVRATREGEARHNGGALPCILGYPLAGETVGGHTFKGDEEYAVFPGDLPEDPDAVLAHDGGKGGWTPHSLDVVRFRPPAARRDAAGNPAPLPHIRLDRALNALIGDRLA